MLAKGKVSEEQSQWREENQQCRDSQQDQQEGRNPADNIHEGSPENGNGGKEVAAKGRCCSANGDLKCDENSDENRVQPCLLNQRSKDRNQNEDYDNGVHEHAAQKEGDVDGQQNGQRA